MPQGIEGIVAVAVLRQVCADTSPRLGEPARREKIWLRPANKQIDRVWFGGLGGRAWNTCTCSAWSRMAVELVPQKWHLLAATMDERARRLWAGTEADALGYGRVAAGARTTARAS